MRITNIQIKVKKKLERVKYIVHIHVYGNILIEKVHFDTLENFYSFES